MMSKDFIHIASANVFFIFNKAQVVCPYTFLAQMVVKFPIANSVLFTFEKSLLIAPKSVKYSKCRFFVLQSNPR